MLARPYIARLSVFSLLIWPSACPLLYFSVTAFLTASRSRLRVCENCCMEGIPERPGSSIHRLSFFGSLPRRTPRNRIASCLMTMKLADTCFNVATFTACDGVSMRVGFMHNDAAMIGEICHPVAGSMAHLNESGKNSGVLCGSEQRRGWLKDRVEGRYREVGLLP